VEKQRNVFVLLEFYRHSKIFSFKEVIQVHLDSLRYSIAFGFCNFCKNLFVLDSFWPSNACPFPCLLKKPLWLVRSSKNSSREALREVFYYSFIFQEIPFFIVIITLVFPSTIILCACMQDINHIFNKSTRHLGITGLIFLLVGTKPKY
jgi:hypothetical protein